MTFSDITATLNHFVGWIATLGLAFLGVYLSRYLDGKARNLVNREDFDKLLEQQRRTTEELESIRSDINHDVWLKQRRWELRRETYGQVLAALFKSQAADGVKRAEIQIARTRLVAKEESDYFERVKREQFEDLTGYYQLILTGLFSIGGDAKRVLLTYLENQQKAQKEMQTIMTPENIEDHLERMQGITVKAFTTLLAYAEKEFGGGSP